jgi:hypothetical protein
LKGQLVKACDSYPVVLLISFPVLIGGGPMSEGETGVICGSLLAEAWLCLEDDLLHWLRARALLPRSVVPAHASQCTFSVR